MTANSGYKVSVPNSIGSGGGIREVTNNRIDIARVARPLKDKEKRPGLHNRKEHLLQILIQPNL